MAETDQAVKRFLEGDTEAFTELVRQWETRIFNLAWRYLGNREDAQDVTQETFISAFKSAQTLREPRSFSAWLYRVALNHCRQRWRSKSPDLSLEDSLTSGDEDGSTVSLAPLLKQEVRDSLETRDLVQKALVGVSEDQRTTLILKEYLGLTLEEIAQVMDCPLSTAKSRLYLGLRSVQRNLVRIGIRS